MPSPTGVSTLSSMASMNVMSPTPFLPCDPRLKLCVSDILAVTLGLIVVLQVLLCAAVCAGGCTTRRRLKARIQRLNKAGESF